MSDMPYNFGGQLRELAVQVGIKEDLWNGVSDLFSLSSIGAASSPKAAQQSSALKVESDPWVTLGTVTAGIVGATVVCLGVKSLSTMWSWRKSLRDAQSGEPAPGPTPLPILGNVPQLQRAYYHTLYEFVHKPASVFWVMSTPFVVVNDAEAIRRVLGGAGGLYMKPKYFGYRSKTVQNAVEKEKAQVVSESADYSPHGDASRLALQTMIMESFDDIKLSMEQLLARLAAASEEAATEDPSSLLQYVREAVIGLNVQVLFGLEQKGRETETARIAEMIGFAGTEFAKRMVNPLKVFVDLVGNLRYVRDVTGLINLGRMLCRTLDESMASATDEAAGLFGAAGGTSAGVDWVHAWVGKVGKIGKLGKVVGLLMASSQTVPLTAVWMLFLIANDERVCDQVRDELYHLGIFSLDSLQFEHLDKLHVADAVIRETLRLYPPFPLIQREAQDDDVLAGITVPQGTPVYVVPWLVHRNPEFWSDPHAFKPNRFLDHSATRGDAKTDWVYLPFGRGSRMCAGSRLAITELKVLLAHTVLNFKMDASQSDLSAASIYPPLGMIPHGVDLRIERRR